MSKGYWIYWYNSNIARTGCVEYTTTSKQRAIELFYRDFPAYYEIVNIHD